MTQQYTAQSLITESAHWPSGTPLGEDAVESARRHAVLAIQRFIAEEQLPQGYASVFPALIIPMAAWLLREQRQAGYPLRVGLSGSQGSGKTTLARGLRLVLHHCFAASSCVLSLDDFYLPRTQRQSLARAVHPLLATRGVPGTHDVELLARTISRLQTADPHDSIRIPHFDKAQDDRAPTSSHTVVQGRPDIILMEGWCLGAEPQPEQALQSPVNALESEEDPEGLWRRYVNHQLSGAYQDLFGELDRLFFVRAPSWQAVCDWRLLQEAKLIRQIGDEYRGHLDEGPQFERFMAHFERITRAMLERPPTGTDGLLHLDEHQRFVSMDFEPRNERQAQTEES